MVLPFFLGSDAALLAEPTVGSMAVGVAVRVVVGEPAEVELRRLRRFVGVDVAVV